MITEDQLEQLCLTWFQEIGYDYVCGYDIAPDGNSPERSDYRQIILPARLLSALQKINPHIPAATLEQVALHIAKPETPILIKNNKAFHQLLLVLFVFCFFSLLVHNHCTQLPCKLEFAQTYLC